MRYKLWPETLDLFKQSRAKSAVLNDRGQKRVLLTEDGKPLVNYWLEEGKMLASYDCIESAFGRLFKKVKMKRPIKLLRKTSASELQATPSTGPTSNTSSHTVRRAWPTGTTSGRTTTNSSSAGLAAWSLLPKVAPGRPRPGTLDGKSQRHPVLSSQE